jgi:hypothetical protein
MSKPLKSPKLSTDFDQFDDFNDSDEIEIMVGGTGFEPVTLWMSTIYSDQLS